MQVRRRRRLQENWVNVTGREMRGELDDLAAGIHMIISNPNFSCSFLTKASGL